MGHVPLSYVCVCEWSSQARAKTFRRVSHLSSAVDFTCTVLEHWGYATPVPLHPDVSSKCH